MSKQVKELMTPDPACCTPRTGLVEIARMMQENDCGEIPVVASESDRRPVGVITDRDIVIRAVAQGSNPAERCAEDCMSESVITVSPETDIDECCDLMEMHQVRRVPVVDDSGRLVGIVAQADVALEAGRRLTGDMVQKVSQPGARQH